MLTHLSMASGSKYWQSQLVQQATSSKWRPIQVNLRQLKLKWPPPSAPRWKRESSSSQQRSRLLTRAKSQTPPLRLCLRPKLKLCLPSVTSSKILGPTLSTSGSLNLLMVLSKWRQAFTSADTTRMLVMHPHALPLPATTTLLTSSARTAKPTGRLETN